MEPAVCLFILFWWDNEFLTIGQPLSRDFVFVFNLIGA